MSSTTLRRFSQIAIISAILSPSFNANAITLTFDDAISGATSYNFDQNSDGLTDAIFSTSDPSGFNTVGPGPNMSYIQEPGLEGTTTLAPDLRVDFPYGAVNSLGFGFGLNAGAETPNLTVTFSVYDSSNNLLAQTTQLAAYTQPFPPADSNYPEAQLTLPFAGTASYATFDFNDTDASRYILDNFNGTFGSSERPTGAASTQNIPTLSEWSMIVLSGLLAMGSALSLRRKRQ